MGTATSPSCAMKADGYRVSLATGSTIPVAPKWIELVEICRLAKNPTAVRNETLGIFPRRQPLVSPESARSSSC
jgi:hypothetical protein